MSATALGKYQLLKRIATGGMAEVYLARVSGMGGFEKLVVVKRILPQLASDESFVKMFLDEARIAATLDHPNIVQIHDVGEADGNPFIAMEYLNGEDLRALTRTLKKRKQAMPLDRTMTIAIAVSSGLHYAHEKRGRDGEPMGIVHRDVNPHNIIVTYEGGVKVVDFGIAKATNRMNETQHGSLKGKIPYMSPEQCRATPLDRRSDVFAIGIMLYELTTSSRLFQAGSDYDVMKQIVEHPIIPPSSRAQNYPGRLESIVLKCLEREPDARYQTAQDVQAELEDYARQERLNRSSIAMASFMKELFGDQIEAMQRAATDDEVLAEHIAEKHQLASVQTPTGSEVYESINLQDTGGMTAVTKTGRGIVPDLGLGSTPSMHGEVQPPVEPAVEKRVPWLPIALGIAAVAGVIAFLLTRGGDDVPEPGEPPRGVAAKSGSIDPPEPLPEPVPDASVTVAPPVDATPAAAATVKKKPRKRRKPKSKPEPASKGTGELRIASSPSCEIIIDGKSRGQTPKVLKLSAGRHKVHLVNSRFGIDKRYTVKIKAGKTTKKRYKFDAKP